MSRTTPLILVAAALALGSLGACSTTGDKSAANVDSSKVIGMQDDAQYVARLEASRPPWTGPPAGSPTARRSPSSSWPTPAAAVRLCMKRLLHLHHD